MQSKVNKLHTSLSNHSCNRGCRSFRCVAFTAKDRTEYESGQVYRWDWHYRDDAFAAHRCACSLRPMNTCSSIIVSRCQLSLQPFLHTFSQRSTCITPAFKWLKRCYGDVDMPTSARASVRCIWWALLATDERRWRRTAPTADAIVST